MTNPIADQRAWRLGSATFTFDLGSPQIADAGSPVTTYTYIGTIPSTVHTSNESIQESSPEVRLVRKVRDLLYGPSCTATPRWWYVWRAIIEDPWFVSQQHEIVERYVHHSYDVDEVNQITRVNVAERLQQDPTLGIGPEEPATKLAAQIQLCIIRNLDSWRHKQAREKRRLSAMPVEELAQESPYSVSDLLEINAAVDALNSEQHDVFEMRSYRYQRSQVANELQLSVSQVDRRNSAAKEKLRRELRDYRIE